MNDSISPADLDRLLDGGANMRVFDVRLEKDRTDVEYPIPGAEWRDPDRVADWSRDIQAGDDVVVFCVHGHQVSQSTRDALRERGIIGARIVAGGIAAWCDYAKRGRQPAS